jgi:hypothetical protein
VLLTTGLMGMLGLCSFRRAFRDGGGGFFFEQGVLFVFC